MWFRTQTDVQLEEVLFAICYSIRSTLEQRAFRAVIPDILHASRQFHAAADRAECWRLPIDSPDSAPIGASTVSDSYHARFSARGSAGRPYYDRILLHGKGDLCPYCNVGLVQELDHYLPKHLFKQLALTPDNLVPCCTDCNRNKDKFFGEDQRSEWFNPFRSPVDIRWLHCEYRDGPAPLLTYSVRTGPPEYAATLDRVRNQFEKLRLAEMYSTKATRRLVIVSRRIARACAGFTPTQVADYLLEEAHDVGGDHDHAGLDGNHWEFAMYQALAASESYCCGGYRNVLIPTQPAPAPTVRQRGRLPHGSHGQVNAGQPSAPRRAIPSRQHRQTSSGA